MPKGKETVPPKHYTIETLNNYLKNPFRDEKAAIDDAVGSDDRDEYRAVLEGLELGTEATRTGIIDNARKSRYIELKKDVYTILPEGEYLIESLSRMGIRMDKNRTSEMGRALKKVFRGEISVKESVSLAAADVREVFTKKKCLWKRTPTPDFSERKSVPVRFAVVRSSGGNSLTVAAAIKRGALFASIR